MNLRLACLLVLASAAAAQGTRAAPDIPREQMWPAPTAEDWKKPVLIKWERTWADAVKVSKETGKPILVCINMDGEIASEHYAGVRYRQKEIAPLYEPYVCVIASVYRHNPRDYDDEGRRIECPRFQGVTCGEHIWIEPIIFEKFCDGQRVAPRHICVDLEGKEVYDVFYIKDTAGVFDAVRDGRKKLPPAKAPIIRGDRPILERVQSAAAEDRTAVEQAYRTGDEAMRRALLQAALEAKENENLDLLRLAIFGLDVDLSKKARSALVDAQSADAAGLIGEALQVPMDQAEREVLLATLNRLGELSPRARWLAGVHTGLATGSKTVDLKGWSATRAGAEYPAPFGGGAEQVETLTSAAEERPEDPEARIGLAEASLAAALRAPQVYASNPRMARLAQRSLYDDAAKHAREAETLGAPDWRVNMVLALAEYYGGRREAAYPFAEKAMKGLPGGDTSWNTMAVVTVFAESRWKAIRKAVRGNERWPATWLADLDAAYSVLLKHPLGTDGQVVWHYELLDWLGARRRASRVLDSGLERFNASPKLHQLLRDRVLKYQGAGALEATYDKLLETNPNPGQLAPFAGYASIIAAENFRRRREYKDSLRSYGRAIQHYEKALAEEPRLKEGIDHAIALALAGRARVHYLLGEDETALQDMMACFARRPASAGSRDKMGVTPGETAQMLLDRLRERGNTAAADELSAALAKLDPKLLAPDIGLTGK